MRYVQVFQNEKKISLIIRLQEYALRKLDNAVIDGVRISVEFAREIPSRIGGQTEFR